MVIYNTLNDSDTPTAVAVEDCVSAVMEEQLVTKTKGYFTLTIVFPLENPASRYFKNERNILVDKYIFTVKKITKQKSSSKNITIECEALWYQISDGTPIMMSTSEGAGTAIISGGWARGRTDELINALVLRNGWSYRYVDVIKNHNFKITPNSSRLYMLRYLSGLAECEINFDTTNKRVDFLSSVGSDTYKVITYEKNLRGITRIDDTSKLCTRVYMFGADGVTVADINGGLEYVEDNSYFTSQSIPPRIISHVISDERFSIKESMLDYMKLYLATYSKPIVSYQIDEFIIGESLNIGDSLIIHDRDLGIQEQHRVIERTIDLIEPDKSTYVLDNAIEDLSSLLEDDNFIDQQTTTR